MFPYFFSFSGGRGQVMPKLVGKNWSGMTNKILAQKKQDWRLLKLEINQLRVRFDEANGCTNQLISDRYKVR